MPATAVTFRIVAEQTYEGSAPNWIGVPTHLIPSLPASRATPQRATPPEPPNWAVIMHDDDTTPRHFAIDILCQRFNLSAQQAVECVVDAERHGKATVTERPQDIAVTLAEKATHYARQFRNPDTDTRIQLRFTAEPAR